MSMNRYQKHQALLNKFKVDFQKEFPSARIFNRHVGLFTTPWGKKIKINKLGMADCYAIINGIHVEFEFKTGKAKQTKEQINWQNQIEKMGSYYFLVRESYGHIFDEIKQALQL